jgi:PAS domain-containing protein
MLIPRDRQTEKSLQESEERYRTLFNLGPVPVYSIDTSGVIQKTSTTAPPNCGAARLRWGGYPI